MASRSTAISSCGYCAGHLPRVIRGERRQFTRIEQVSLRRHAARDVVGPGVAGLGAGALGMGQPAKSLGGVVGIGGAGDELRRTDADVTIDRVQLT